MSSPAKPSMAWRSSMVKQCFAMGSPPDTRSHVRSCGGGFRLQLVGDPLVHDDVEHAHGYSAVLQDHVVEGADVELGSELILGLLAQLLDLDLADHVGER